MREKETDRKVPSQTKKIVVDGATSGTPIKKIPREGGGVFNFWSNRPPALGQQQETVVKKKSGWKNWGFF